MAIVNGKNVTVHIYDSGWKLYACASSCSLTVSTSTVETSTTGSGLWASFEPQKHSWSGTIEGAVNLDDDGKLTLYSLRALQIAMTKVLVQFERTDEEGNVYMDQGLAIIINSSDTGAIDSVATFSIELQGTGVLVQVLENTNDLLINSTDDLLINSTDKFIL